MGNSSSSSINQEVNSLISSEQNAETDTNTERQPDSKSKSDLQSQREKIVCDKKCRDDKLKEKVENIVSILKNNFNKSLSETTDLLYSYNSLYLNLNNVLELLIKYLKETYNLEKDIKNTSSDILTNDRKTYYEEQSIDRLKTFYNWMKYLYILIKIIHLICIFVIPTNLSIQKHILIFILLSLYPFIIDPIFNLLNWIYQKIVSIIPKNVYKTL